MSTQIEAKSICKQERKKDLKDYETIIYLEIKDGGNIKEADQSGKILRAYKELKKRFSDKLKLVDCMIIYNKNFG